MSKKFWTSEKLLGLSALFVSLLTLMVFVYQTNLIRKQQYRSVYPHLSITNFYSGSVDYQFVLKNDGVGPALIQSVDISDLEGNSYKSISKYLHSKLSIKDSVWVYNSDLSEGRLIPANEEIILFGLFNEEQTMARKLPPNTISGAIKLRSILNNDSLKVSITYSSIYDESWTISNDSDVPVKN